MKPSTLLLIILFSLLTASASGQNKFSLATDVSLLHNFNKLQRFNVVGQTLHINWHLDEKNTFYTWFTYHSNGKYNSNLTADAKSISTQPQTLSFSNHSEMRLRQLSLGIKRYLLGSFNKLDKFNLYGSAGFGLIIGTASNSFSTAVDTSLYMVQNNVVNGSGDFKRLSFDLSAGWEIPIAYEIFFFTEARLHIPTTNYPNNFLLKNDNAPFLGGINLGLRILFNNEH